MKISWRTTLVFLLSANLFAPAVAEDHRGALGKTSAGIINVSLRISGEVRAGLLRGNGSDLETLLSAGLVQGLQVQESATLSLCILSSGGGMFEVTSLEFPGQVSAFSRFGNPVPLQVGFGAQGRDTVKHRAVEGGCTQNAIVPVTINLLEESGPEFGRIHGRLKLLVKSE